MKAYLIVSILLFSIGIIGIVSRRNLFIIYISLELMLNSINLAFVAISAHTHLISGDLMAIMIMAIAAAEAALFLALFVALFRNRASLDIDLFTLLGAKRD